MGDTKLICLGIDKDAGTESLSEFDIEIRRRIWTLLYIWDWYDEEGDSVTLYLQFPRQMSAWLGRPNLIDQKNLTFKFPNLRLDQSTTEPNLLSPFAHVALQAQLGRRVATVLGEAQSAHVVSAEGISAVECECEKFIEELPPIFRVKDPDTSLDEQHPYFVFQRHQLHCVIFVTMLDFLKPYLTRDRRDQLTERDDEFRIMGVDIALRLLQVARNLFNHEFPINAKFHMVVFSIFDTATLLCSAIVHDCDRVLPRRQDVMDVIESSLDMLHQLSVTTKLGASSYNFLSKLVEASPELSQCSPLKKRRKHDSSLAPTASMSPPDVAPPELTCHTGTSIVDAVPSGATPDGLSFDLDHFLANDPFGDMRGSTTVDMGGMEQIWDWEDLNLDGFGQHRSATS
jgi:hypothetical protein